ncbi:hypothetical protein [Anthocerotibacter panamensis]|uniref:hypothetical protein n=1 Tax=Anthocerotibacter panamensis TaxID=2857077 RepID=UPI001C4036BB|nr:hypothetical protein [Anthocerotibacter panamensis]
MATIGGGTALLPQNKLNLALQVCGQAGKLNPTDTQVQGILAEIHRRLGRG